MATFLPLWFTLPPLQLKGKMAATHVTPVMPPGSSLHAPDPLNPICCLLRRHLVDPIHFSKFHAASLQQTDEVCVSTELQHPEKWPTEPSSLEPP